jgi:3-oxoacyl-[acyl-carrier protein] reductase
MTLAFTGKTAVITGAAHGFGRAIALAFAKRGANVWACDVLENELRETRELIVSAGGTCTARTVDVRDKHAVGKLVSDASGATGHVGILVNNAGGVLGQTGRPLE